ncbi:uncharacterized protein LOC121790972 [Salvia splendens]|uniref:uncharacterized protein LOC121790972 n=1 Tax=Salvia splendens TaxID=180675 RepID=UPI001C2788B0|nr:uncharacterized protein LOC121790972 [Salvia splendens]
MNPSFISNCSSSSDEDGENSHMIYIYNQYMQDMQRRIDNNNMLTQFPRDHQIPQIYRGSVPGHIFINRDREGAHARLYNDDFVDNPLYNETMFCRRFRMSRPLFLRIVDAVKEHDDCFMQRSDGTRRLGLSSLQKVVVVDYDLWIWHAYFGLPGSNNDINVLDSSHLSYNLTQGIAPPAHYVIPSKEYNIGYYPAD